MPASDDVLVWVDLEMTGLDPQSCGIIEMAMILTDSQLDQLTDPVEMVIWQPPSVLDTMSPFVRSMHTESGLLDKVVASDVTVQDAEQHALAVLTEHATYRTARLCGNSVWQDRRFLAAYMPVLEGYLHYRQIDVTTVKELGERWYTTAYDKPETHQHTALFDIRQSIEELKFLRQRVFK